MVNKSEISPGYKTTEAYASLLSSIFVMVNLPPDLAAKFVAGLASVYIIGRSIVKAFNSR